MIRSHYAKRARSCSSIPTIIRESIEVCNTHDLKAATGSRESNNSIDVILKSAAHTIRCNHAIFTRLLHLREIQAYFV